LAAPSLGRRKVSISSVTDTVGPRCPEREILVESCLRYKEDDGHPHLALS
jgi:hypothetical protein